jgi:hypothetical protein
LLGKLTLGYLLIFIKNKLHMSKRMNKNNIIFMFLFLIIGIIIVLSIPISTIMTNAQSSSGSTSGGSSSGGSNSGGSKREGNDGKFKDDSNNSKDQEQKDNTDKQMGICFVGAGGPCNGDSNWDGRDDRTAQCILSGGCGGLW